MSGNSGRQSTKGKSGKGGPGTDGDDGQQLGRQVDSKSGLGGSDGSDGNDDGGPGSDGDEIEGGDDLATDEGSVSDCVDKTLQTKVRLLTPTVQNGAPGNRLIYEISVVDCHGKAQMISAQSVHFDIDVEVSDSIPNSYELSAGSSSVAGVLEVVDNVDLFGKTGAGYFHHRTDKSIALTEKARVATLTIDLRGQEFSPIDEETENDGDFVAQSFLRFGEAAPVSANVRFVD